MTAQEFQLLSTQIQQLSNNLQSMNDRFEARFEAIDRRFEAIDQRIEAIEARLDGIDLRLDAIDQRLDEIDLRFEAIEKRLDTLEVAAKESVTQEEFARLFKYMEKRFNKLEEELASKADKQDLETLTVAVDGNRQILEHLTTEVAALTSTTNRHETWLHQLAHHTGATLHTPT